MNSGRLQRVTLAAHFPRLLASVPAVHGQVLTLAAEAGSWRLLILILGYTGLRWGEATALRVCDIDLDRRRIDVRRAFSDVGGRVILGTPKSHQSRTVPVPRFVAVELAAAVDGKRPDDLVFHDARRQVMRLSTGHLRARAHSRWPQRLVPDSTSGTPPRH